MTRLTFGQRPSLYGIFYTPVTSREAVSAIVESAASGQGGRIVTPNVDILRQVVESPQLRPIVDTANMVLADGMPIVWALKLRRSPVPERVSGASISFLLAEACAARGVGLFLLGGDEGAGRIASERLRERHHELRVGWHYPPPGFEDNPDQVAGIITALKTFGPSVCLCGLGFPKQDRLAVDLSRRFPDSWFVGVGASINFLAGATSRAPLWMQRSGLEWLYRLVLEPRRLAARYLWHDVPFASKLLIGSVLMGLVSTSSQESHRDGV